MPHTVGVTPYILDDSKLMIGEPYTAGSSNSWHTRLVSHTQVGITSYILGDSKPYQGLVSHTQMGVTPYRPGDSKS